MAIARTLVNMTAIQFEAVVEIRLLINLVTKEKNVQYVVSGRKR
jgi:hypothetical protein